MARPLNASTEELEERRLLSSATDRAEMGTPSAAVAVHATPSAGGGSEAVSATAAGGEGDGGETDGAVPASTPVAVQQRATPLTEDGADGVDSGDGAAPVDQADGVVVT